MIAALAVTPAAAGLAACSSGSSTKSGTTTSNAGGKAADKVTYLTGFGTTAREDYPYVGLAKGFFTEAGIDVTILPGAPSDANLKSLAAGKAQFASVDFVSAIRGAKAYPNYRAVAAVQSTTLLSMITLSDKGITVPADLAGKTLGAAPAAASQTLFPTYAKLAGLDATKIKFVNAASDQLPSLLATGKVDAIGAYAVDTPGVTAAAQGKTAVVLPYSKYLTDLYGTVLLATTSVLGSNPDLVQRFVGALIKSIRYAVDNPEEAGTLINAKLPLVKAATVTKTMTLMKPYVTSAALDQARVMRGIALLETAGLAQAGLTPETVVNFDMAAKAA
ncbi:MAG TPA: ABC transporter substrate-binding protein [Rugosimonospora sp.]|nr:ABC transporter substrate-binding protein [Rugosimonospora sp.]